MVQGLMIGLTIKLSRGSPSSKTGSLLERNCSQPVQSVCSCHYQCIRQFFVSLFSIVCYCARQLFGGPLVSLSEHLSVCSSVCHCGSQSVRQTVCQSFRALVGFSVSLVLGLSYVMKSLQRRSVLMSGLCSSPLSEQRMRAERGLGFAKVSVGSGLRLLQ